MRIGKLKTDRPQRVAAAGGQPPCQWEKDGGWNRVTVLSCLILLRLDEIEVSLPETIQQQLCHPLRHVVVSVG
jgi:hypothetical protein